MKNVHSKDDEFHTTSKTGNFKRVTFITKVLPWKWLKWRGKSVPRECCGYFSHPFDVYEANHLNNVLVPADIVVETRAKTCSSVFYNH